MSSADAFHAHIGAVTPQASLLGLSFPLLPEVTLESTIGPPEAVSSALDNKMFEIGTSPD